MKEQRVSAQCKIPSHQINVDGAKIHYLDEGTGHPILFLHGMPTSSYLWRNIIPHLTKNARCIAPDLIGMGKSDKPDIAYTVYDHIHYIEQFIQDLDLKDYTMVLHGWGSVIGFDIASRHEKNISGLAFYEAHIRPTVEWDMLSLPVQQLAALLDKPEASYRAIVEQNYLVRRLLPSGVLRTLTAEEMNTYNAPFKTTEDRKPLWQYIQELPLGKENSEVIDLIENYSQWLQKTKIPKLMMYALPGFITTMDTVVWAKKHLPNLTLVELKNALHFAQESMPDIFAGELKQWYLKNILE